METDRSQDFEKTCVRSKKNECKKKRAFFYFYFDVYSIDKTASVVR